MFQTKVGEKIKKKTFHDQKLLFFPKIVPFNVKNISTNRAGHRWQYDASALHAGYLSLHTKTENM